MGNKETPEQVEKDYNEKLEEDFVESLKIKKKKLSQEELTKEIIKFLDEHLEDEYGFEDTRRALIEARRDGIPPYCITIDKEG